ncbi:MAG: TIGR04255 family protein [Phycisphaerae bacterium]
MVLPPPFKIDLTEQFLHLSQAPIAEAVIDIRARAASGWEEAAIAKQLQEKLTDYPHSMSQRGIQGQVKFDVTGPPEATTKDLGWMGIAMASADRRNVAEYRLDGFTFHRLPPYESWELLLAEAMRLWKVYVELARPTEIQRIGLRFINRLELPLQEFRFEDYIQPAPQPPQGLAFPFAGFFHHDTLAVPDYPYAMNIIRTIQLPQNAGQGVAVILDIDVGTIEPMEWSEGIIASRLAEMRWLKNKAFFGSVTPNTLEKYT